MCSLFEQMARYPGTTTLMASDGGSKPDLRECVCIGRMVVVEKAMLRLEG